MRRNFGGHADAAPTTLTDVSGVRDGREARGGPATGLPSVTGSRRGSRQSRRVSSAFACATFPYQRAESFGVRAKVSRSHATSPKVGRYPEAHS